jgi:methionyl-tRNA formyltransferase
MKIIFIGTSEFAAVILERLARSTNKPFLVISAPKKPAGRKNIPVSSPVELTAEKYNIPTVQPKVIDSFADEIKKLNPDIIVLSAYGQIISEKILLIPRYGCLNIHPSLLPLWRGPSPIQRAILNGDEKTGVSLMKMVSKVDAGPIFCQKEIGIEKKDDFPVLRDKLAEMASEMIAETLPKIFSDKIIPSPQDESKATYAKMLSKEEGKIDWQKPADYLERQIRAFHPWPGSFTFFKYQGKSIRIKILKASILKDEKEKENSLTIKCAKDFLVIEKLQMEGGKKMDSKDFLRGHPDFVSALPI